MNTEHSHEHSNSNLNTLNSKEEAIALLNFMYEHNKHHCQELIDLSISIEGQPDQLIMQAVAKYNQGNALLLAAIDVLKKGEQ